MWKTPLRPDQGDPEPHGHRGTTRLAVVVGKATRAPSNCQKTCETRSRSSPSARRRPRPPIDNKTPTAGFAGCAKSDAIPQMVEHAFENEIDDVKRLIEQGFYVDSVDAGQPFKMRRRRAMGSSSRICWSSGPT